MAVYKDNNGTWYISVRYVNWKGEHARKVKRGFATKREATDWERNFLHENAGNLDMSFETFVDLYKKNLKERLKLSTWQTKVSIIDTKILPYFKKKRINDIKVSDVVAWQNTLLNMEDENGERYSLVYLKTIHNQLSAIFNHAVRYYDLQSNPAAKAGNMGKEKTREMLYWTKEEYIQFSNAIMDKPVSFYAFEILYWCGLRLGEMLALTPSDFNFEKNILRINKSYQKIGTEDIITDPKTPKSIRNVQMPDFLADEMQDYISSLYEIEPDQRIFPITKYSSIASYILDPKQANTLVEIVTDAYVATLSDQFSRTGTNMLFEYQDSDGYTYVVFSLWNVITYKIKVCSHSEKNTEGIHCPTAYFYHTDGTQNGTIFAVVGSFRVIAMSPANGLATLSQEIKNRLSKLGERDLSREYLQNCIAKISKSLPAYQEHRITIADLLDFEHEDRIIPVYILEQIYSHKDEYLPSEDFYRNMQRILRTDNRFVFTKDTAKEILERYLVMDREGTFATLLDKAIEFFETTCSGKPQGSEK